MDKAILHYNSSIYTNNNTILYYSSSIYTNTSPIYNYNSTILYYNRSIIDISHVYRHLYRHQLCL